MTDNILQNGTERVEYHQDYLDSLMNTLANRRWNKKKSRDCLSHFWKDMCTQKAEHTTKTITFIIL